MKISGPAGFRPGAMLPYCLGAAALLALVMAVASGYDRHPDESNHLAAAVYYKDHFLPPVIGDPAVRHSYSVWGVSYLNYHWAEYFCAGKFALLVSPVIHDSRLGARLFNVFLFFVLAAFFAYRFREGDEVFIIPCFLLVTPQVWYIFSYSNNDAFALFVSALAVYQIAYPLSLFRKLHDNKNIAAALPGALVFGLLAGLLLICKPNYWVFLLVAVAWVLLSFPIDRRALEKYAVAALAALCVFGFRIGLDLYANGETNFAGASYINYFFNGLETKPGKLLAYQEEIAEPDFKPSTLERDRYRSRPDINMRAKGVTIREMLSEWRWHIVSLESLTGVYGYMNIFAADRYYKAMSLLYLLFGAYLAAMIITGRDRQAILQGALIAGGCAVSVLISFYLSWSYAFQAQGRYLFPVLPMVALLTFSNRDRLHGRLVNGFVLAAFSLSVWSFVFVGLTKINGE